MSFLLVAAVVPLLTGQTFHSSIGRQNEFLALRGHDGVLRDVQGRPTTIARSLLDPTYLGPLPSREMVDVIVRAGMPKVMPSIALRHGSETRGFGTIIWSPSGKEWVAIQRVPANWVASGSLKLGVADGKWRSVARYRYRAGVFTREKGNRLALSIDSNYPKKSPMLAKFTVAAELPVTIQHTAWRFVAYDRNGNELRSAGSVADVGQTLPNCFGFTGRLRDFARIDLQTRSYQWFTQKVSA